MELGKPEEVGLSTARLARIGAAFQRRIDKGELPGCITVVARKGKVAHFQCQGLMDIEAQKPMAPDAILRFYSMSKPVTTAAIMMLFEEGYFQLDDPVSAFIPEFKEFKVLKEMTEQGPVLEDLVRPITFRHLMTHTSGLVYPDAEGTPVGKLMAEALGGPRHEEDEMTLEQWSKRLVKAPLAHQPGICWTYGFSIDVLGRLIEVIAGQPFDVFLKERMFGPLGMADTDFYAPESKHARLAKVYGLKPEGGVELVEWSTNAYWKKPLFLSGGGGLASTAADYLRFAQMLLNGGELEGERVLGRRTVQLMRSGHVPQLADSDDIKSGMAFGKGWTFGLGGRVFVDESVNLSGSVGTYSWSGLASTTFWVDPKEELTALFLPQMIPGPMGMHEQFQTLVYQALE